MSTQLMYVPAGSQSAVFPVTPLQTVCAGPQVQGGTTLVEFAPSPVGPWSQWAAGSSSSPDSFRPLLNSYVRVTAATQQTTFTINDLGGTPQPLMQAAPLVSMNGIMASANGTTIAKLFSLRIPPGYLPLNFKMTLIGSVTVTNNVNVKTLTCLVNGVGGTSFFTSPSLASNANYQFIASFCGDGTGQLLRGLGSGATGGLGLSTTADTTLAFNYTSSGSELEVVVASTKATGTDTMELHSLSILLQ